jgi:hypothetical protein
LDPADDDPFTILPATFKVTRSKSPGSTTQLVDERTDAQTYMRVIVRPSQPLRIGLDYRYEERFKDLVASRFPELQEAVLNQVGSERGLRSRKSYLYKIIQGSPDTETIWALMESGAIGFATTIAIHVVRLSWSLPDVAANIISTIDLANQVFVGVGYFGEVKIDVEINPGGGIILRDAGLFGALMRKDYYKHPWPVVIPQHREQPVHLRGASTITLDYNARSGVWQGGVSDLLNGLLRDLGFAADLDVLRSAVAQSKK